MRWIQIGERAHAVVRKNKGTTLCGLELGRAQSIIVSPPFEDRCGNCDKRWRDIGRASKPKRVVNKSDAKTVYRPRLKFDDFDYELHEQYRDALKCDLIGR